MRPIEFDRDHSALLLIDLQPDFCPGGALPVEEGDQILPGIRELMQTDIFAVQAATQDWHPRHHISFADTHQGKSPFETIQCHGHEQVLWPLHCVEGTPGARLHPDLPWDTVDVVLRKGRSPDSDSYSGFRNNYNADGRRPSTGLAGYLKEREIQTVFTCGLARDVCVLWTALDAAEAGFSTFFIWDLTRSVNPQDDEKTRSALDDHGVNIIKKEQACR